MDPAARRREARARAERADEIPSLIDLELELVRYNSLLDDLVEELTRESRRRAEAEAQWKSHLHSVVARMASSGERTAKDSREAAAMEEPDPHTGMMGRDLHRSYLMARASEEATKEAMRARESQLSSIQTLIRGVRQATGLDQ